ncbi:MAG: Hpt domain-containing protein, partial [Spirochaetales bacterium]|nr:Hpt domain-containing protein [Spirochaetales bacterium]
AARQEDAVFDFPSAVDTFMNKKDIVVNVMRQYLEKTGSRFAVIKKALDAGQWDSLRAEAHAIKGGGWNLRARALGDAAARLEDAARNGEARAAEAAFAAVLGEYKRLAGHLAKIPEFAPYMSAINARDFLSLKD